MIPESSNQKSMLPLSFAVGVVGIRQQATILEDLSDMACYKYRVRFENGIEDIFTIIEGPEITIESSESGHEHYGNALGMDLYELSKIVPGNFLAVLPVKLDGEEVNVWLSEEEPDPGEKACVMVSYGGHSGFQLYRLDVTSPWAWREYKPQPLSGEEKELASDLSKTMDSLFQPLTFPNVITSGQ